MTAMSQAWKERGAGLPQDSPTPLTLASLIQRRLLLGLLVGFLLTSAAVSGGSLAYYEVARAFNEATTEASIARQLAVTLNDAVVAQVLHTRSYIIAADEEALTLRDLAAQDFERAYAELHARLTELQSGLVRLPETTTLTLQELRDLQREYDALADEIIPLLDTHQNAAAISLFDERSDAVVLRLLATKRHLRADINAWEDQAEREYFLRTTQIILVTAFVFLLGALLSGLLVTRLLASPIAALHHIEQALIETAQRGTANLTPLPRSLPEHASSVFQAYNTLVARLRESEASRLEFMAKVVHTFRSPLAVIMGYAELMSTPALRPLDADLEGFARVIAKEASRLGQMVEQVVTAVRIDDGQLDLTLAPVWLGPLVAEVVAEAKQRSRREITFEDHFASLLIACDALYLRQMLWNLLDNALKFSPPHTPVQVSLRRGAAPGRAEIRVADQGIGIAEADRSVLFTRFGRIYNARTQGRSGSGLGLYIAKYVVEQHRGEISVQSAPGQGATFVVSLPLENGNR
jgi:signal transduction histidine kinase